MKNYLLKLLLVSAVFVFPACHPQKKIAGNYSYETECLGVEMDGTQSLKAFGTGSNNADAIEQAKKMQCEMYCSKEFEKENRIVNSVRF